MTAFNWSFPMYASLAVVVLASRADAQQPQTKPPAIIVYPQVNGLPPITAWRVNPPAYNPDPFYYTVLNHPYMNQNLFVPFNPFPTQVNPLFPPNNPFANNPFAQVPQFNNPFVNPFNNPFMTNPLNNPMFNNPFTSYTPPIAMRLPGRLFYRGPDLHVNPTAGFVYLPLSGVARTANGSVFFRVPGSGLPTVYGAYAPGTGLYFDPQHNTFLNPATGVISRPGMTQIFSPWIQG